MIGGMTGEEGAEEKAEEVAEEVAEETEGWSVQLRKQWGKQRKSK